MPIRLQLLLFGVIGNVLVAVIFISSFGYMYPKEEINITATRTLPMTPNRSNWSLIGINILRLYLSKS